MTRQSLEIDISNCLANENKLLKQNEATGTERLEAALREQRAAQEALKLAQDKISELKSTLNTSQENERCQSEMRQQLEVSVLRAADDCEERTRASAQMVERISDISSLLHNERMANQVKNVELQAEMQALKSQLEHAARPECDHQAWEVRICEAEARERVAITEAGAAQVQLHKLFAQSRDELSLLKRELARLQHDNETMQQRVQEREAELDAWKEKARTERQKKQVSERLEVEERKSKGKTKPKRDIPIGTDAISEKKKRPREKKTDEQLLMRPFKLSFK